MAGIQWPACILRYSIRFPFAPPAHCRPYPSAAPIPTLDTRSAAAPASAAASRDLRPTLTELERALGGSTVLLSYLTGMPSASRTHFGSNVEWMRSLGQRDEDIVRKVGRGGCMKSLHSA